MLNSQLNFFLDHTNATLQRYTDLRRCQDFSEYGVFFRVYYYMPYHFMESANPRQLIPSVSGVILIFYFADANLNIKREHCPFTSFQHVL
jgi:hypothetical protein